MTATDQTSISNENNELTREEIVQLISQTVNSAITQRNNSFEKKMEGMLSKLMPQEKTPDEAGDTKPGRVPNAEIMAMKKQLDDMRAEKQMEVNKRRDTELRNNLREQLTKAGVAPQLIKAAMATLISEDKLVSYTSDEYAQNKDQIVFKSDGQEEDLTLGLSKYLRSEEGQSFLSPKGAQGSGDRSYNKFSNNNNNKQKTTDDELVGMLKNLY